MRMIVQVDERMLREVQAKLGSFSNKAPNAIARALNRAATNIKSNMSKEVRKYYTIKASDIKSTILKYRASRSNLSASVVSRGNPIGLDKFKVSPKTVQPNRKKPIKVGVKKDGLKVVLGAFVADVAGIGVFERTTKARYPIRRLYGPSVPQMLGNVHVREEIGKQGYETFQKRLDHEINWILEKGRG